MAKPQGFLDAGPSENDIKALLRRRIAEKFGVRMGTEPARIGTIVVYGLDVARIRCECERLQAEARETRKATSNDDHPLD